MQKCIIMWLERAVISKHKATHFLPPPKTLFSSLKHIFQPHKPPYDTFAPKCGKLHFFKGIIYCTFVVVECIHAYYTTTEK